MASKDKKGAAASAETPVNALKRRPILYGLTIILLVFAIAAFIWVPSSGQGGRGPGGAISFGSYAGNEILYEQDSYLVQSAQMIDRQVSAQFGNQESLDEATLNWKNQYVWSQAFNQTVIRTAMLHEARASGHIVADKTLSEQIRQLPGFMEDGRFSKERWDGIGAMRQASIRDGMVEDALLDAYSSTMTDLHAPQAERDFLAAMDAYRRSFEVAAIPFSEWPDSEARAFGSENASLFRRMTVNFVRVEKDKKVLDPIYEALVSGAKSLEDAEKESGTAYTVVEQASRQYWELREMFAQEKDAEAVFALAPGAWSPILQDKDGQWIAFQCHEAASAADVSNADTLASVRSYVSERERGSIEAWAKKRAEDFAAEAKGNFSAACKKFGISPKTLPAFPLNFGGNSLLGTIDSAELPELASAANDAEFFRVLFSLEEGDVSNPMIQGESVMVFRFSTAGAAPETSVAIADGSYLSSYMDKALYDGIMASKKLKNRFQETYDRYFTASVE